MADISVTAANVIKGANAVSTTFTAGVALTAGQVVYQDTSDKKYKLADADVQATALVAGIVLNDAAANQPVEIQTAGDIDVGGTLVVGTVYVLSLTAGGINTTTALGSGDFTSVLGIATAANKLAMNIQNADVAIP